MRTHALFVVCAAALAIPTYAAPLSETTVMNLPLAPPMTLIANAPTEIPNLPMASGSSNKQMNAHKVEKMERLKSLPLRRGVNFRQADYGVNPNVTFDALRPVAGVEASPSTAATPAAHSRRWQSYAKYGDLAADKSPNDLTEVDATPSVNPVNAAPEASAIAQDVSDSGSGDGSTSKSSSELPIRVGDLSKAGPNHLPVTPDASLVSVALGKAIKTSGESRYASSYAAHDALANAALGGGPASTGTVPSSADIEKKDANFGKADTLDHGLQRRVLAPTSYLSTSAPVRRMKQFARDVVQFVARHSLEFNTDAILPSQPDQSLNMSDPDVMREEARKKNIGFFNIDSNKAAPKPKQPKVPLNTTQLATTNGNATQSVPLDDKQVDMTTEKAKKAA
ncbi:hypothetical protein OH76DRAFT_1405422 [Lentinus brumalis]|uniref:Uncharacterized protein n=1 Tax=Lentinus brumalis TaxID=2498619 RepID=A0A371D5R7_9APHY|nr:hypothetical protein OH76DRAFT_1405422 [Polyporus brumalis]